MPIVWIELAQCALESIDIVQLKFLFADRIHAIHDFYEPAPCLKALVSKKERSLPLREHTLFGLRLPIADEEDFSRLRNLVQKDVAADPAGAPCRHCKRLSLLDDLAHKKLLRNDEEVGDAKALQIIVQQEKVRIVVRDQAGTHGAKRAVQDPGAKFSLGTLQFVLFAAIGTKEVGDRPVGFVLSHLGVAAV